MTDIRTSGPATPTPPPAVRPGVGLNPEQRRAVDAVTGPVAVHAGPGTGKTRVVTHRIAAQVRLGVAPPGSVLAVTFTERAAGEMLGRLRALGVAAGGRRGVTAATFHSAALRQVRFFWSRLRPGATVEVLPSKVGLLRAVAPRVGDTTGIVTADLAAEIEWVKAHGARSTDDGGGRSDPTVPGPLAVLDIDGPTPRWHLDTDAYRRALAVHDGPWPDDHEDGEAAAAFAAVFAGYEEAKAARSGLDFEDLLAVATALVGGVEEVAERVRSRYTHLTVDEFQDVNRLQWDLLDGWLGDRDDVCVVGDADQAIYGFAGASPAYLDRFLDRYPEATTVRLVRNYRSTQPILDLAGRVLRGERGHLRAEDDGGSRPVLAGLPDADAERTWVVERCRALNDGGTDWGEMAVLYRFNAQSERWEEAFADAGIPYVVKGDPGFFGRRHVTRALTVLAAAERAGADTPDLDDPLVVLDGVEPARLPLDRIVARILADRMSWSEEEPQGDAARERWADLGVLVELAGEVSERDPEATLADLLADLRRRADLGAQPDGGGVNLLTLHRAKGLEFDAVFIVSAEEGRTPSRYAIARDERVGLTARDPGSAVGEERRLFYVGLTRARDHLHVSWTERRKRSRFLDRVVRSHRSRVAGGRLSRGGGAGGGPGGGGSGDRRPEGDEAPLDDGATRIFEALREWRLERARNDEVPAYVVLHDASLREIARRRPDDRAALFTVRGVGRTKLDRYGDEILAVVAREAPDGDA